MLTRAILFLVIVVEYWTMNDEYFASSIDKEWLSMSSDVSRHECADVDKSGRVGAERGYR